MFYIFKCFGCNSKRIFISKLLFTCIVALFYAFDSRIEEILGALYHYKTNEYYVYFRSFSGKVLLFVLNNTLLRYRNIPRNTHH